jgi:hypothetical protein
MNPAFAARAMNFPTYPAVFKIPMTPPIQPQQNKQEGN